MRTEAGNSSDSRARDEAIYPPIVIATMIATSESSEYQKGPQGFRPCGSGGPVIDFHS